ncbi:HIT family protein [Patescibacteria group bacterium]|nr:HIT family protein [Patescibacteria group bacterium]MBU1705445.1 HIT family protein [Patescibacteria group bacterium]
MNDCIFCKIIAGQMPAHKIYEDDLAFAFLDIRPINPGHTLVIPKAHQENFLKSSEADMCHLIKVAQKIAPGILKAVGAESFNLGFNVGRGAGQVIFHTHLHIMPRFPADGHEIWQGSDEHPDFQAIADQIKQRL